MNDKNLELIPDKDGFLFEIEDKIYLLVYSYIVFLFTSMLLFVFYLYDFNLSHIFNSGRAGRLAIFFSIPVYIFYLFKTLYYVFFQKRKTIKFYTNYILTYKDFKIILEDVNKTYKIKLSLALGKGESHKGLKKWFSLIIGIPMLIIYIFWLFIRYRKFYHNNIIFITNNGIFAGIAYRLLNSEEKSKVDLYFKKYLNINLDEVETRWIFIPDK